MLRKVYPVLSLKIKPSFTSRGDVSHLSVAYTIPKSALAGSDPHLNYTTWFGNVASHPYSESDVYASDTAGRVPFIFVDETATLQQWRLGRDPVSDLTLQMDVFPRKVDIRTALGPRVDLRLDHGGMQGSAGWFLPQVTQGELYIHAVEWDLSHAPPGTRAVWSHGEGPHRIEQFGTLDAFQRTIFMVGPIQSSPAELQSSAVPGACVTYWFGELPPNLRRLKHFNTVLYGPMCEFFQHTGGSYRVFIRSALRGYGGSGFTDSFVFEYDPDTANMPDNSITSLFAHEMVHSFVLLSNEDNGEENGWFVEGIAEYYAALLPYRFNLVPPSYVTDRINSSLVKYYTNPEINMPMRDALKYFFTSWYAEWIPYSRGFAYFLLVDDQLRRIHGPSDSKSFGILDRIVIDLSTRYRRGQTVQQRDWFASLGYFMDGTVDYISQFHDMLEGKTINLAGRRIGSTRNMLRETRQQVLEFGFSRLSTSRRIIEGVISGSPADLAGLRNGDKIVETGFAEAAEEDPHATYFVVVNRNGRDVRIEYLPREDRKVSCWQLESFKEDIIPASFISGR